MYDYAVDRYIYTHRYIHVCVCVSVFRCVGLGSGSPGISFPPGRKESR